MPIDDEAGEEPTGAAPAPAGLLTQLRPYLPTRYIAEALCTGSLALSRWAWGKVDSWQKGLGVLGGLYLAGYEETHGQRWILPMVCGAWIAGALALSPTRLPAQDEELEEFDDEQLLDDEDQADVDDEPVIAPVAQARPHMPPLEAVLVAQMVREIAADNGWVGVHLDDLLSCLPGRSRDELIWCLQTARIEVHPGIKLRLPNGVYRNRQGVRLDALPAGLGEALATPVPGPPAGAAPAALQSPAQGPAKPFPPPLPDPLSRAG